MLEFGKSIYGNPSPPIDRRQSQFDPLRTVATGSYPASENRAEPAILRSGRPAPFGFLATAIARIATLHIAVPAAYRPEVHLLHKLPDSSRAGRRCCVPSPYRWIFARPAEDPPPHPLPCSQLRLASRCAFQSR